MPGRADRALVVNRPFPPVLVLDGEQRAALAVTRSLGRQGLTVHVGSSTSRPLAGASRHAASEGLLPDPHLGNAAYADAVHRMASRHRARLILPSTEVSALALLEERERLQDLLLPMADAERFRRACDKAGVLAMATALGVPVPPQWIISGAPRSGDAVPASAFPVVVKPQRSLSGADGARRKATVRYARDHMELEGCLQALDPASTPVLIQSRIFGEGTGVFLLRWEGRTVARFAHRRVREKPPSGGVSVCCESTDLPERLLAQSESLLAGLDWSGVAMIEYKRDFTTGTDYLMEINPRFWGSLQLAVDAGVDFPWYLTQLAFGQPVHGVDHWPVGIRSRWRLGELDHLIARLRRSRAALNLGDDAPSLPSVLATTLAPWLPGHRGEVFRWADPLPGMREALQWIREL